MKKLKEIMIAYIRGYSNGVQSFSKKFVSFPLVYIRDYIWLHVTEWLNGVYTGFFFSWIKEMLR